MEENTVNEVTLKVMEALQEEAYKGIVRIDTETMRDIGVRIGDIVEIEGGRKTVGIVDRAYPTDIGQTVIRMDGILRRNAKTGIGEVVKVRRAAVKEAKTVTIAPAQKGVTIKVDPNMFKRGLLGRAVVKGDILALGGTRRRRSAMSDNPFFEDVFQMFEEDFMGGFGIAGLRFVVADGFPKSALVITEATDLKFSTKAIDVLEEKVPYITYEDIGGLTDEIEKVREMVELPLKHPELFERLGIEPPKGILLHGPPGCGKTLLAKAVANESDATFLLINGPEVVSKFVGEAEKKIREKFEEAEKKAPSILFIDEIDAIASKREESYGEVEKRMVAQLLATMDGMQERGKVIVIAATNRPNSIDPALRRPGRFDREIVIGVPSKEGRLNVLKIHTRNMPLKPQIKKAYVERGIVKFTDKLHDLIEKLDSKKIKIEGEPAVKAEIEEVKEYLTVLKDFYKLLKADLKENEKSWETVPMAQRDKLRPILIEGMLSEFASRTHGFVGADLAALCKEAAINVIRRVLKKDISLKENQPLAKEVLDKLIILDTDFEEAMRIVIPSGMREVMVEIPNVGWNDIGGLEDIKRDLKEAIEWPLKYPQRFKDMGIRAPRGVLLYGPPGCGKTMLAKAVAHESAANFILVKGPELLNMWIGESLPYDEKLIVKKDGIITRMKIGEIVETKADVEVLCFDKQKRVIFSKIQDHIKHKATSQLVEVKTKSGRKIRVTQDHSLFTFVNGKVVSLPTSYLIPGESHIAVPKSLHLPRETMKHINLYEGFRRDTNVFVGNVSDSISKAIKILGKKPVAKKLHVSVKYLDDILSKKLPVSLPLFDTVMHESGLQIKTEELTIKLKGSTHSYPALFSIDPSFWRLVGLWV
ncbi:MAG: AAA family ATPase, partial [bacterium]|nr:AAA family ATPase [bacterium]